MVFDLHHILREQPEAVPPIASGNQERETGMQPDPASDKAPRRKTCTDHATCCGQHFSGLTAFDAHRIGGICRDAQDVVYGPNSKRSGLPMLQAWTEDGYCDKEPGCYVDGKRVRYAEGVTIWQIATTEEQREKLATAFQKQGSLL